MTNRGTARAVAVTFAGVIVGFGGLSNAHAKPSGSKIMEAVENREDGKSQVNTLTIQFKPKRGTARIKRFTLMRKDYDGHDKLVTFVTAPADLRDSAFLVWDMSGKPDRRWLYLAALGQVRRLSSGDGRGSFFGTDFVYEDLTNRDPEQDRHKFVGKDTFRKWDCYVVDSKPKDGDDVDFAKYRTWVWKKSPIVVRQDFYDSNGKVYRRATARSLKKVQGIWTLHQGTMKNLEEGSTSRLQQTDIKYNADLPDGRFSKRQMSRGAP